MNASNKFINNYYKICKEKKIRIQDAESILDKTPGHLSRLKAKSGRGLDLDDAIKLSEYVAMSLQDVLKYN